MTEIQQHLINEVAPGKPYLELHQSALQRIAALAQEQPDRQALTPRYLAQALQADEGEVRLDLLERLGEGVRRHVAEARSRDGRLPFSPCASATWRPCVVFCAYICT